MEGGRKRGRDGRREGGGRVGGREGGRGVNLMCGYECLLVYHFDK